MSNHKVLTQITSLNHLPKDNKMHKEQNYCGAHVKYEIISHRNFSYISWWSFDCLSFSVAIDDLLTLIFPCNKILHFMLEFTF